MYRVSSRLVYISTARFGIRTPKDIAFLFGYFLPIFIPIIVFARPTQKAMFLFKSWSVATRILYKHNRNILEDSTDLLPAFPHEAF